MAENLAGVALPDAAQDVIFPLERPYAAPMRHILILRGNLAPRGAVLKFSGARTCDNYVQVDLRHAWMD